ncbi:hypothetical protein BH09SUM1_BH09SUM1_14930 [soil metagenome]
MSIAEKPASRAFRTVDVVLLLAWAAIVAWLYLEHGRIEARARETLLGRVRDVSNSVALVTRSGRGDTVRQSRLEGALKELTESPEVLSVALLNSSGEVVAAAGEPINMSAGALLSNSVRWEDHRVIVTNPVELGDIDSDTGAPSRRPFVVPDRGERGDRPTSDTQRGGFVGPPAPRTPQRERGRPDFVRIAPDKQPAPPPERFSFGRPPWLSQEDFDKLRQKRGLHGFVLVLSTDGVRAQVRSDFILRTVIASIALIALGSLGLVWHGRDRSMNLQLRLVRSQEMNEHLREMNLAAAGLAHETRNPLNVVRTISQLIEKDTGLSADTRARAQRIVDEVDTVNHRLEEFIKYSRPAEPRVAPVDALAVIRDVRSMLEGDCEEKKVTVEINGPQLSLLADESLFRQVVFNLLLNAVQAVEPGGKIVFNFTRLAPTRAELSVEDDGPGVLPALRQQIFTPYFTTRAQGSGLGLAVLRQIALAHQWEVDCEASQLGGARFVLRNLSILDQDRQPRA